MRSSLDFSQLPIADAFSPKSAHVSAYLYTSVPPMPTKLSPMPPKLASTPQIEPYSSQFNELAYSRKPREREYQPYSLKDYREIKPTTYQVLGGIGPARVGTKEWEKQRLKQMKMKAYAERVSRDPAMKAKLGY
jgi:hypothetical protein